jgi:radical SAM-linked protein
LINEEQIKKLKDYPIPERIEFSVPEKPKREFPLSAKVVLVFEKLGYSKFLSLLDLNRVFTRTFRRFGVPLRYSQGFNPHPRFNVLFGLPVGVEGLGEVVEVELVRRDFDFEGFLKDSEEFLPRGIRFKSFFFLDNPKDSAAKLVKSVTYRIKPFDSFSLDFLKEEKLIDRKGRRINVKESVASAGFENGEIFITLNVVKGSLLNLQELLNFMGLDLGRAEVVREELLKT